MRIFMNLVILVFAAVAGTLPAAVRAAGVNPTPYSGAEADTYCLYNANALNGIGNVDLANTLADDSGHGHTGAYGTTRSYASDLNGSPSPFAVAVRIATSNLRTPAASLADLNFAGDFTLEMWVKLANATTGGERRFFTSRTSSGIGWIFRLTGTSGSPVYGLQVHEGGGWRSVGVNATLRNGWTHWAMAFHSKGGADDSNYTVTFSLTGTNDVALQTVGTFDVNPSASAATLKTRDIAFSGDFDGGYSLGGGDSEWIDSLRISSVARTEFGTLGLVSVSKGTAILFF